MGSRSALVVATAALAVLAFAPMAAGKIVLRHDTFGGVYRSPGGAVAAGTPVRLRLSVSGALATRVLLRVEMADPVTGTSRLSNLRMRRLGALWTVTYRTPTKPAIVSYSFRVTVGRRTLWYGDDNSGSDVTKGGTGRTTSARGDAFRITVYARDFTTPTWLQGAVVYSIFPDRFRNGDPTNDYCRVASTSGCPTFYGDVPALLHQTWNEPLEDSRATGVFNRDFFGGDLQGVTERLDYLKSLGVDAIWLTPIFKARSNHRYDTEDYQQIDPGVGGDAAFSALSAAANARGIRLILDGVFNHTSSDSVYFDRYNRYPSVVGACESPSSPFRSWYEIAGSDVPCTNYSGFANLASLPTLNDASTSLRDFIFRGSASVVAYWTTLRGADGWRLDVAHELSHSWWRDFRTSVKRYAPEAPLIGEITAGPVDATEYLVGDELDGVMNYRFRQIATGFARQTSWTDSSGTIAPLRGSQAAHALQAVLEDYPKQAAAVSFNLVDSHDTNRALYVLTEPGDTYQVATERQQLAALLQFTAFGSPMIYYGDEVGIDAPGRAGFGDPYNRAPYPWTDASGNVDTYGPPADYMLSWYTRLGALRHALPALRTGTFTTLFANNTVFAFGRAAAPNKPVIVALNKNAQPAEVAIPLRGLYADGTQLEDALGGVQVTAGSGRVVVSVAPRSGMVLVGR
jgi:glycosidase